MTEIDYCVSLSDIQNYTDDELSKLLMYACQDKKDIFRADCTFWMCIMEINRRKNDEWPVEMNVISYANIYDEAKNIIFKYGNPYQLYIIDGNVLVYDDNWIPYIFSYIEDDMRCVWKFFCIPREDQVVSNSMS